jgi:hypothetical protein
MRRLVIAAALGAAVAGTAVPALAQASTPKGTLPVGVTYSTKNGVFVGTTINGQPGAGAWVANGEACVGFSYQVPQCAVLPPVTIQKPPAPAAPAAAPRQQLPVGGVVVYHDDTRTAVGVGDVGVVYYSDGYLCPVVSTQKWPCVQVQLG